MQVTIETPQGGVTTTVTDDFVANAQVDPDGVVTISFFQWNGHQLKTKTPYL